MLLDSQPASRPQKDGLVRTKLGREEGETVGVGGGGLLLWSMEHNSQQVAVELRGDAPSAHLCWSL